MAIALKKRRIFSTSLESVRGTFVGGSPTNDAHPTIREAEITAFEPASVDRGVLRLSLTKYPDVYPGVATATISVTAELGGLPANPQTDYASPNWTDLFRCCGFQEYSNQNLAAGGKPRLLRNVTSLTGGVGGTPLRHGETVTGNGTAPAGTGTVLGDFFAEDDVLAVVESAAPGGTLTTWTGALSGRVATGSRGANAVVALGLTSDVNFAVGPPAIGMQTLSSRLWLDGKELTLKGCMGNVEVLLDYGDMIRAKFDIQGVVNTYIDATPANWATPFELHKVAPTFLGKEIRVYEISATPDGFGRDAGTFVNVPGTPTIVGSLSTVRINSGNDVILRKNALDASGVQFALITNRAATGSFDPDEVASSDFDWVTKFVNGTPMRFKAMIGAPGTTLSNDGNTIDLLCPGIVISQLGDSDRDGINNWDGQFKLTGGDYDSTATGELPGNDNEFTIIHR